MSLINGIFSAPLEKQETQILIHGLEAAGKTTMLDKLKRGRLEPTIPTIGFKVEKFYYRNLSIIAWDLGGRSTIQSFWKQYYEGTDAIVFVVDSTDHSRIDDARDELMRLMHESHLRQAALLVFANKQDLPRAMSVTDVIDKLGLTKFCDRRWSIHPSCASSGDGLYDGLDWLHSKVMEQREKKAKSRISRFLQGVRLVA